MSSDNAKPRAAALPHLDWQGELDAAMADIDARLTDPHRRGSDSDRQTVPPQIGQLPFTTELLDEIAWRVAQQIRRNAGRAISEAGNRAPTGTPQPAPVPAVPRPAAPLPNFRSETSALQTGKIVMIRFKLPLLPWPFRLLQRRYRKKQHPLTTARLRA